MTSALPRENGSPRVRAMGTQEPETHYGVPVLHIKVGEALPTPRAPLFVAARVTPDLARYLLTFNHPNNRRLRPSLERRYAREMDAGRWEFLPECIVFSRTPLLQNGQNRLMAVTRHGSPVWMLMTFGWHEGVINAMDRGATKSNADAFRVEGVANNANIAAVITKVSHYEMTVKTTRGWAGLRAPTSLEALEIYETDPEGWMAAVYAGDRVYKRLDKSLSPSWWACAYRVIYQVDPAAASAFFDEITEGTGAPRSASRILADRYRRRPAIDTTTGDTREPIENIIRAFNAWRAGKSVGMVGRAGFELSRVR